MKPATMRRSMAIAPHRTRRIIEGIEFDNGHVRQVAIEVINIEIWIGLFNVPVRDAEQPVVLP